MSQGCRVVAIGEVLWDVFDDSSKLGGAPLNFAAHASRLGHSVRLISGIGDDKLGHSGLAAIQAVGLDTTFIQMVKAVPTGVARVQLGTDGQTTFRIERPAAYDEVSLSDGGLTGIAAWSPEWLYHGTLYAYEERSRQKLNALAAALPNASRFYDVNLRQGCFTAEIVCDLLASADVVKLNETEMACVAGFVALPHSSIEAFCHSAAERFGWRAVAVTLGAAGCAIWCDGDYAEAPGYVIAVGDTVGAGDAFAAAMLHGLSCRWPARDIADFSNQLGSLIASRPGGIPDWTLSELRLPGPSGGSVQPALAQRK